MFGRKRKEKKAAKKARKAEEEAAKNIQLLRVAPRGTRYDDSPDYPLAHRNPQMSRSMDALNGAVSGGISPHPLHPLQPAPVPEKNKKKMKKSTLRRAQSLAEDGILGYPPQDRYTRQRSRDAPVYYFDESAPLYYINEPSLNGDHHSTRPRYLVAAVPPHHSLDPAHLGSVAGSPVLYHHPQHHQPRPYHQAAQVAPAPLTPTHKMESPTSTQPARYRNVHIIPKPDSTSSPAKSPQRRPVSHFYTSSSSDMRPTSTPLRTPSPARSPSPAVYHTGPRKPKGKAIRIIEGWDEGNQDTPQVVQSHEVGVAPKSRVMDEFNNRSTSSPFSITINDKNGYSSSVTPTSADIKLREQSRRNKARPVSAAPWIAAGRDNGVPIQRQNGHMTVDFSE